MLGSPIVLVSVGWMCFTLKILSIIGHLSWDMGSIRGSMVGGGMGLFLAAVHGIDGLDLSGGSDCEMKRSLIILKIIKNSHSFWDIEYYWFNDRTPLIMST